MTKDTVMSTVHTQSIRCFHDLEEVERRVDGEQSDYFLVFEIKFDNVSNYEFKSWISNRTSIPQEDFENLISDASVLPQSF